MADETKPIEQDGSLNFSLILKPKYKKLMDAPSDKPDKGRTNHVVDRPASRNQDDLTAMIAEWRKTGDADTYGRIMQSVEPTVSSALHAYAGGDKSLKPRATILTHEALSTYDPERGAAFKTHLHNSLRRLSRYKAERSDVVRIPENVRLDSRMVISYINDFNDQKGREPSLDEISEETGFSHQRIRRSLITGTEHPASSFMSEKGESMVNVERDAAAIWKDYVYHDLDPVNQKIFEWLTGYGGVKTLPKNEIARKLKISPAAVTGRVNTIVKRLQEGMPDA